MYTSQRLGDWNSHIVYSIDREYRFLFQSDPLILMVMEYTISSWFKDLGAPFIKPQLIGTFASIVEE